MNVRFQEEAHALYASAGRFDMINKMYQAQSAWTPVRIIQLSTIYTIAQFLQPFTFSTTKLNKTSPHV